MHLYFLAHIGHPYYGKRGRGAAHLHLNEHSQKHNPLKIGIFKII